MKEDSLWARHNIETLTMHCDMSRGANSPLWVYTALPDVDVELVDRRHAVESVSVNQLSDQSGLAPC